MVGTLDFGRNRAQFEPTEAPEGRETSFRDTRMAELESQLEELSESLRTHRSESQSAQLQRDQLLAELRLERSRGDSLEEQLTEIRGQRGQWKQEQQAQLIQILGVKKLLSTVKVSIFQIKKYF